MYPFVMIPLPYVLTALGPTIDERSMDYHYNKHYAGYVDNLNRVLKPKTTYHTMTLEKLLRNPQKIDIEIRQDVINFGGGVYNHELFWHTLGAQVPQKPTGKIALAIDRDFGSFELLQEKLIKIATSWFGSGWGWLCCNSNGTLSVMGTSNQDCPLSQGLYPLMTLDVWEHAYYLQYQNRRTDFVKACWNLIDWQFIQQRYKQAIECRDNTHVEC